MRKFGLIGFPLGHSFSKQYFTDKFRNENITGCSYENYPLESISLLPELIKTEPTLSGLNVTIPYKSSVISYLDNLSPEASEIGAVNVVRIERGDYNIKLSGFNSDVTGFTGSLLPFLRNDIRKALVLGTGGSSKAVCYSLGKLGIDYTLVSRTPGAGTISYEEINKDRLMDSLLIVNTTPVGMFPDVNACPNLNYKLLDRNHILFDLVYNPGLSMFLRKGQERGCTVISGLKMLHLQAERAWEIWNNRQ
ncbi:MAG TPA: shikimate dehydrogenase [Bacteroidales bacterium]|nr:shikimate dehydrogenase [Bacteroidales bacterium]